MAAHTLFEKIWNDHVVRAEPDGTTLLYIDRHLVHEVTSPQAFEGLTVAGRTPRRSAAAGSPHRAVQRARSAAENAAVRVLYGTKLPAQRGGKVRAGCRQGAGDDAQDPRGGAT